MTTETYAERIARIAMSPAAQAVVDGAPPMTRPQLDIARAACSSSDGRYLDREATAVVDDQAPVQRDRPTLLARAGTAGKAPRAGRRTAVEANARASA